MSGQTNQNSQKQPEADAPGPRKTAILLTATVKIDREYRYPGDTVEVDSDTARYLIRGGFARRAVKASDLNAD